MSSHPTSAANTDPPVRWELVARVRRAIQEGTYETPEKWAITLRRLLALLGQPAVTEPHSQALSEPDSSIPRSPPIPHRE
jgi:hypothetical protein